MYVRDTIYITETFNDLRKPSVHTVSIGSSFLLGPVVACMCICKNRDVRAVHAKNFLKVAVAPKALSLVCESGFHDVFTANTDGKTALAIAPYTVALYK